jgi:transcriptional regulator
MHPSRIFHEADRTELAERARASPFALVVCANPAGGAPLAVHTPVLMAIDGVSARFHCSQQNDIVSALQAAPARLIWTGPNCYISPDWYEIDDQVPTWNYVSAEASGQALALDADKATQFLDDLSAVFEATLTPKKPWTRTKMTPTVFSCLLKGIVVFEMKIDSF